MNCQMNSLTAINLLDFVHEKLGFLDIGCSYAPLAGYGYKYKIELYEPNKIKLTMISAWRS